MMLFEVLRVCCGLLCVELCMLLVSHVGVGGLRTGLQPRAVCVASELGVGVALPQVGYKMWLSLQ